jgi:hypothetical protein
MPSWCSNADVKAAILAIVKMEKGDRKRKLV